MSRLAEQSAYVWELTPQHSPDGGSDGCGRQWGEDEAFRVVGELVVAAVEQEVNCDGPVALGLGMEGVAMQGVLDQLPEEPAAADQARFGKPRQGESIGEPAQAAECWAPDSWHHPPALHSGISCQQEVTCSPGPGGLPHQLVLVIPSRTGLLKKRGAPFTGL